MVMARMRRDEKEDEERRVRRRGRAEQRFFCERRARKAQLQASRRGAHAERAASPPRHELIAWSRPPVGGKQEEGAERGGIRMRGREEEVATIFTSQSEDSAVSECIVVVVRQDITNCNVIAFVHCARPELDEMPPQSKHRPI